MTQLKHEHLITLTLTVDFAGMLMIGKTPAGRFSGERLNGQVLPGADWVINRPDGVMEIDVRLPLQTDDGAMIYLSYQGRFLADPEVMGRFAKGALLKPEEYSLAVSAKFESGAEQYLWLNNVVAAGTGEQTANGPVYSFFEIG